MSSNLNKKNNANLSYYILILLFIIYNTSVSALEFESKHNGGNCTGCEWIQLNGIFEKGDAEKFAKFIEGKGAYRDHNVVYFNSAGGSLAEGIKIGRILRKAGFTTAIGKTELDSFGMNTSTLTIDGSRCVSACAYAFLGGKHRQMEFSDDDVCLGFHQFYNPSFIANSPKAATNLQVATQKISGLVIEYLEEIDADPRIYSFASRYVGKEIGCISEKESRDFGIDNTQEYFSDIDLVPFGKGLIVEVKAPLSNRILRLYCSAASSHLAYFVDPVFINNLPKKDNGMSLFFSVGDSRFPMVVNTVLIANDKRHAIFVVDISKQFALDIVEGGSIVIDGDYPRVMAGEMASLSFDIKGDKRAIKFALNNCV